MGKGFDYEMQKEGIQQKFPGHQKDRLRKFLIGLPREVTVNWKKLCCQKNHKISHLEPKG